jgi:hypothetical protein
MPAEHGIANSILNGEYMGVYILMEKIKRDKGRVNITKIDTAAVSGDLLSGGYIVKIDKLSGSGNDGWYLQLCTETRFTVQDQLSV